MQDSMLKIDLFESYGTLIYTTTVATILSLRLQLRHRRLHKSELPWILSILRRSMRSSPRRADWPGGWDRNDLMIGEIGVCLRRSWHQLWTDIWR